MLLPVKGQIRSLAWPPSQTFGDGHFILDPVVYVSEAGHCYRGPGKVLADLSAVTDPCVTGGCLCGGVRFELSEPAQDAGYCHCTRCRRRTGTSASPQARIDGRTFRLLQGEDLVKAWRHSDGGFEKCFCRECGAHLFSRNPDDHAQMSVRLGAFDGDPGVRPSWRAFVAYAAEWEPIPDDGLQRFDESKPR